jgi:hypothetical protein
MSSDLKVTVRSRADAQELRLQAEGRLRAAKQDNALSDEWHARLKENLEYLIAYEHALDNSIKRLVKHEPMWTGFLEGVKGCGPIIGGRLIGEIGDITRFPNPSKLWAYCGLHVKNGRAAKRVKGEKANWHAGLKSLLLEIFTSSVLKARGEYAELYYNEKQRLETCGWCSMSPEEHAKSDGASPTWVPSGHVGPKPQDGDFCTKIHIHYKARRKMAKRFLADYFEAAYRAEGLEPPKRYADVYVDHPGHRAAV